MTESNTEKDLLSGFVLCFRDTPGDLKGPRSYRDCREAHLNSRTQNQFLTYKDLHTYICHTSIDLIWATVYVYLFQFLILKFKVTLLVSIFALSHTPIYPEAFLFTPYPFFPRAFTNFTLSLLKPKANINTL